MQLLDASIEAGGVPEVPMVKSVRPDLGWYAGDEHGTVALLQMGKVRVDQIQKDNRKKTDNLKWSLIHNQTPESFALSKI